MRHVGSLIELDSLTGECWRFVPGFVGFYSVSSLGRVRNDRTGLILSPGVGNNGYPLVSLHRCRRGHSRRVHALVAAAFLGPCPDGLEVNHIDGNKLNAQRTNLEYVTRSQNLTHAWRTGLRARGEGHGQSRLTEEEVREIRASRASYSELCRQYGMSRNALHAAKTGRTWKHVA